MQREQICGLAGHLGDNAVAKTLVVDVVYPRQESSLALHSRRESSTAWFHAELDCSYK
jgi:hypothetical protein